MALFRAYHRTRAHYRERRAALYRPGIEAALMEEPADAVCAILRPRRWGDADIVQEVMVEAMRHLEGGAFETLRQAALRLGLSERALRDLRARDRHRRGRALDRLGVLRPAEAVPAILSVLDEQPLELKLVALRALAALGDHTVLPRLVREADALPPPLLPRLISLLLEFDAPGRRAAVDLINRHPRAFPPSAVRDILRHLSVDFGTAR
ncbi:MAG: hypothetical protein KGM24_14130 [Elusimicrobia bacterium]|nr:hypothetical protein [Elusimicrobiota bacterium]